MDILGIIDDFLDGDRLTDRQVKDAITELNDGMLLEEVAKRLGVSVKSLRERLLKEDYEIDSDNIVINNRENRNSNTKVGKEKIDPDLLLRIAVETQYNSTDSVAKAFNINLDYLVSQLKENGYKLRWLVHCKGGVLKDTSLLKVLAELNLNNKTLNEVSLEQNTSSSQMLRQFRKEDIKENWVYETSKDGSTSIADIDGLSILTDIVTGKLLCINYNNQKIIDNYQIDSIVGRGFITNVQKKLVENQHYIILDKTLIRKIKNYLPQLSYLSESTFYTIEGVKFLFGNNGSMGEYTTTYHNSKELEEKLPLFFEPAFLKLGEKVLQEEKIDLKQQKSEEYKNISLNDSTFENLLKELNELVSFEAFEKKFGISSVEMRHYLKIKGYYYNRSKQKWLITAKQALRKKAEKENRPVTEQAFLRLENIFTEEDIKVLHEMISERKLESIEQSKSSEPVKSLSQMYTIHLNDKINDELINFSERNKLSISRVIEIALRNLFQK
ncbi:hypothetical protein QWJ34_01245 [Saccharibacillus sp. CPCC 101409]|uniref:hypothetical protein n=1 Tax=Saccharibacillus sp. CPCC 101409 TaxID=3058041 RepID=UPI0026735802|nr:hypothetical protein [Saccharibacillus sp. CPCC 101409]MDO3408386.1 hypothetical protein [Saccharibacillus sp. CPCC 101409]